MKQGVRGFTLIELMIVITVIGILAAAAIPFYQRYTVRTKVSEGFQLTDSVKLSVADYYQSQGSFPPDNATAGLLPATQIVGRYVQSVEVMDGVIRVSYGDADLAGQTLTLTPTDNGTSVRWTCTSSLPATLLPPGCK